MKLYTLCCAAVFLFVPCQGLLLPPKTAPTTVPVMPSQPPTMARA